MKYVHKLTRNNILKVSGFLLLATLPNTSFAADALPNNIGKDFYISGVVGPEVWYLGNSNAYWGIGGQAELCKAGVGSMNWLDLCAGATGFKSIQNAVEVAAGIPYKDNMITFGGLLKPRAHLGMLVLSPYAGLRHIKRTRASNTAYFGGLDTSLSFWDDKFEVGLKGEVGKTTNSRGYTYYSGGGFLRVNF